MKTSNELLTTKGKDCTTCQYLNSHGQYIGTGVYGKLGQVYDTCGGFPRYDREGMPPEPTKRCPYRPRNLENGAGI